MAYIYFLYCFLFFILNFLVSDDSSDSKNDARISSLRNLLALLSSARFYTLYEVVKHVSKYVSDE